MHCHHRRKKRSGLQIELRSCLVSADKSEHKDLYHEWMLQKFCVPNFFHFRTCSKPSSHSHTLGATFCRCNIVVGSVFTEPLRECDGSLSTKGWGGVPVDQVGVGWVCTIVNGAGVPWLNKNALHKGTWQVGSVNMNCKVNVSATCGRYDVDLLTEVTLIFSGPSYG